VSKLVKGAHDTKEDGWASSENYTCSKVQVLEYPPNGQITEIRTAVKFADNLKIRLSIICRLSS
jgi:hypothetical protein